MLARSHESQGISGRLVVWVAAIDPIGRHLQAALNGIGDWELAIRFFRYRPLPRRDSGLWTVKSKILASKIQNRLTGEMKRRGKEN
jgi:hypothetical protein